MNGVSAQWNISRSVYGHVAASLFGLAALGFGVGGWAATTELAGAVVAPGALVVDSAVKKIQHPTGGVVGAILVRDGARVRAGDVLLRLDDTVTRANLAIVLKGLVEAYGRQARLEAEREGAASVATPVQLPELARTGVDFEAALSGERTLFQSRRQGRSGQKSQLTERIGQLREEIKGLSGQIEGKRREIALINQELEGVRELWRKNLIPIQRVTALERDAARLDGEHGQLVAAVAQTKGKISETQLQILQVDQDLQTEVAKDLRETQGKISELEERRVAAQDQLSRVELRAPQDGVVYQLSARTIGGVIGPGEQTMLIVPSRDQLVVQTRVSPRDIDNISMGQAATLRFTSFNQRTTPEVSGSVTLIGADQAIDQKTGAGYFDVQITPSPDSLAKLQGLKLVPGMPVEAFVQTTPRTVLSYFAKPLTDQLARAFRED